MAHNEQHINLEAYLDGELSPQEAAAFKASLAADPGLQSELDERLAARREFRLALGEDIPADDLFRAAKTAQDPPIRMARVRRLPISRISLAIAASICLVILVPRMLRNDNGAEGPRSILTMSGQVTVVRYGEIPGETTMLETGAIELPAGLSR